MNDFDQALLAQVGVLKAAVSALFMAHSDHHVLRDEFRLQAGMAQAAHSGLTSDVAKREANDLIAALVESLGPE